MEKVTTEPVCNKLQKVKKERKSERERKRDDDNKLARVNLTINVTLHLKTSQQLANNCKKLH